MGKFWKCYHASVSSLVIGDSNTSLFRLKIKCDYVLEYLAQRKSLKSDSVLTVIVI